MRDECCVCLQRTSRRTPCGHWLCSYCERRLRRRECPNCRLDLPSLASSIGFASDGTTSTGERLALRRPSQPSAARKDTNGVLLLADGALRDCETLEALHEVAVPLLPRLAGQPPTARRAVLAAVTKRCCELLRIRPWASVDDAITCATFVAGLREDGLLEPLRNVELALVDACIDLCGSRPKSVSAVRTASSRADSRDGSVRQWPQYARLLQWLADHRLLGSGGVHSVAKLLESELRRRLQGVELDELAQQADALRVGMESLAAGFAAVASSSVSSPGGRHERLSESCVEGLCGRIREAIGNALEAAERRAPVEQERMDAGATKTGAREALAAAGLLPQTSVGCGCPAEPILPLRQPTDCELRQAHAVGVFPMHRHRPATARQCASDVSTGLQWHDVPCEAAWRLGRPSSQQKACTQQPQRYGGEQPLLSRRPQSAAKGSRGSDLHHADSAAPRLAFVDAAKRRALSVGSSGQGRRARALAQLPPSARAAAHSSNSRRTASRSSHVAADIKDAGQPWTPRAAVALRLRSASD